jgi:hypothetical protein
MRRRRPQIAIWDIKQERKSGSGIIEGIFHVDETCCCWGRRQMLRATAAKEISRRWRASEWKFNLSRCVINEISRGNQRLGWRWQCESFAATWLHKLIDFWYLWQSRESERVTSLTNLIFPSRSLSQCRVCILDEAVLRARAKSFWCVAKHEEILHRHQRTS